MKPLDRRKWIFNRLMSGGRHASTDILDSDFVCAYMEATGAKGYAQFYGAPKCPMLGRDLSGMARDGSLRRGRVGLQGMESGFPRWVWSYHITNRNPEMWASIYAETNTGEPSHDR